MTNERLNYRHTTGHLTVNRNEYRCMLPQGELGRREVKARHRATQHMTGKAIKAEGGALGWGRVLFLELPSTSNTE